MTVTEAITFWERRHSRLISVATFINDPSVNSVKRNKGVGIMERWLPSHMKMMQKLNEATKPIPKLTRTVIPTGGFAIVGEKGKEVVLCGQDLIPIMAK